MKRRLSCWACSLIVATGPRAPSVSAQQVTAEQQLTRALAALDSTQTERGVDLLRDLLRSVSRDEQRAVRVRAHLHLAAAYWSLGLRDSTRAHFSHMVRANPFAVPDPGAFNPEIVAAFRDARQATPAVGLRAPADTVIRPDTDSYRVAVAVGRPGEVLLRLVYSEDPARNEARARVRVDSLSWIVLRLTDRDSFPVEPGDYQLTVEALDGGGASATVTVRIARQPFDTAPHEPPLASASFRAEARKGPPVPTSAAAGIAFGAMAAAIPMVLGNQDLGSAGGEVAAVSVGLGISVAGLAGVFLGRRMVPIQENVEYNRSLVLAWEQRNHVIAEANEQKRRRAPLRVTVGEGRP